MSSEVSAFIICLITLDRFLALRFPFSRLHFSRGSALIACAVVWVIGIALATVPLLPMTSHWQYYSQSGICIPLPFATSARFQGYGYSFSVMILLNFVLFLLIAVGQAIIYWSVRSNSLHILFEENGVQRRHHRAPPDHHCSVGLPVLVPYRLGGCAGLHRNSHPWRGQRLCGHLRDALQLRAEPLPLHLQRADGETPANTAGELAEAAGNTTAYRADGQ